MVKNGEKMQTLLAEVLRRCDSILEALGGTVDGGGDVILGVGGGINTVSMGGDASWDNIGTGVDGIGSVVRDTVADVILASDTVSSILTSTSTIATSHDTHANIITTAHDNILRSC
ncbi:hypothetical protein GUJ93_ZPchr0010g11034 [Zizania palustris]|uniref:Uncharacterized protein n=1 Tax=Zizania palustris TaxID=103762 RepID=A0A8J5TMA7_ZIZPA|nr:hypothetical protein GUJ93_ZPchr0010g11034 [Zizania palustris]